MLDLIVIVFFLFQNLHNINIFFYLACMYKFSSIYLAPCATVNNNKPAKNTLQSGHYALKVRVGMWDQWITRHWRSLISGANQHNICSLVANGSVTCSAQKVVSLRARPTANRAAAAIHYVRNISDWARNY